MNSKEYVVGRDPLRDNLKMYKTVDEAISLGISYVVVEAENWSQAKELATEIMNINWEE